MVMERGISRGKVWTLLQRCRAVAMAGHKAKRRGRAEETSVSHALTAKVGHGAHLFCVLERVEKLICSF